MFEILLDILGLFSDETSKLNKTVKVPKPITLTGMILKTIISLILIIAIAFISNFYFSNSKNIENKGYEYFILLGLVIVILIYVAWSWYKFIFRKN